MSQHLVYNKNDMSIHVGYDPITEELFARKSTFGIYDVRYNWDASTFVLLARHLPDVWRHVRDEMAIDQRVIESVNTYIIEEVSLNKFEASNVGYSTIDWTNQIPTQGL